MKFRIVLTMLLCCLLVFSSCQTPPTSTTSIPHVQVPKERIWAWNEINNDPIPPNAKAYPLADLIAFFGEITDFGEKLIFGSDINKMFPIEFYRKFDEYEYIVYPVEEGGTFYVTFSTVQIGTQEISVVSRGCYFDPTLTEEQFTTQILPLRSNYADVKRCAPFSCIHPSYANYESRDVSYSVISKDLMAEIHYVEMPGDPNSYSVVQEIRYYARQEDNWHADILAEDLEYSINNTFGTED